MSDHELPELPSDEELGLTDDPEPTSRKPAAADPVAPVPPSPGPPVAGPAPPPEPARSWRGPLTLAALVGIAWFSSAARALPAPAPAATADTTFSSARALVEMVDIARLPHPPGSPEHARIRDLLVDRLSDLGLDAEVQTSASQIVRDGVVRAATVRNVAARLSGTGSTGAVLLMAHYDSRAGSPGAADDASGVAAILETVRAIRAGAPLRNDLMVLFTDAEELGLLGARAFVETHPWVGDVSVVLNVDMRGGGGPSIMFETGENNGWIVEAFQEASPRPFGNSLSHEVYRRLPNDTDFTPFLEAGKQGLNFAGIGRPDLYHQAYDTPSNFQEATLQHHGLHLLGMARALGDRDLTEVDGGNRVFFRMPALGLISYWVGWVPAVGLLLLLAVVAAFVVGRRQGGGIGSAVIGLVLALLATAGGAGVGWFLFRWVRNFHPEYGSLPASAFHSEGWYVLAVAAAVFALVATLFGFARRRASLSMLSLGAMVVPLLAALYATFAAPAAAMNLQWPVVGGLAGAALVGGVTGSRRPGPFRWILLLALAAPILAVLVPLTELLWVAMSISIAPILGALVAWTLVLLLPLLDVLTQPNRWWAPITGLVLAGVFTGVGLLHARPTADRPTPTTLVYALDHDAERALWAEPAGEDPVDSWVQSRVGILGEGGSLEGFLNRPATRAGDGQAASPGDSAAADPGPPFMTGPAPLAEAPRPEAFLVQGAATPDGPVRIGLRSAVGAEMMTIWSDDEVRWTSVNGRPIGVGGGADASDVRSVVHWGAPEDALVLELEPAPGTDTVRLVVVEHHLRPAELVGAEYFARPPDMVPSTSGVSDRALLRSVVSVALTAADGATDTQPAETRAPADLDPGDAGLPPDPSAG